MQASSYVPSLERLQSRNSLYMPGGFTIAVCIVAKDKKASNDDMDTLTYVQHVVDNIIFEG